jgi:hypothetical protein
MFVKVKNTAGTEKIININQIECVTQVKPDSQNREAIRIETKSTTIDVYGTLESFAKTLFDIMTTQRIMWYVYYEKK